MAIAGLFAHQTAMASQVVLSWQDNSSNESGFQIQRSLAGLFWSEVATVGADVTRFTDRLVLPSVLYSYRIRAFNAAGFSAFSNAISVRVPSAAQTGTPPTISAIADQTALAGTAIGPIPFTVADAETPSAKLTVDATSSNDELVPLTNIRISGSGRDRTVKVTPVVGESGTTTIVLTVSDGGQVDTVSFDVVVKRTDNAPVVELSEAGGTFKAGSTLVLDADVVGSGAITYQWFFEGDAIPGATDSRYEIPRVQQFHAGDYHVRVRAAGLSAVSKVVNVAVESPPPSASRLLNLSTRARCGRGSNVMIPGFVIEGTGAKQVLLRAVGPTLGTFGMTGVLPNPQLQLNRWNGNAYDLVTANRDWRLAANLATLRTVTSDVLAFVLPEHSRDAAILTDLVSNQYTVVVSDESSGAGVALVELYDVDSADATSRLTNFSNRGFVGTGGEVMIVGFVVSAEGPLTLLIRAAGPTLGAAPFNVSGVLSDPIVEIYGSGAEGDGQQLVLTNDNWGESRDRDYTAMVAAHLQAFPLAPEGKDSALVATLTPGAYTVVVRGAHGETGIALVELYALTQNQLIPP